jgi:hypothetical protein
MNLNCRTAMVSGAVGGYFVGRTKKAKLALVLAALFMGRRHGLGPQELIKKGMAKITEIPQFSELGEQVREELVMAARTALASSLNRRIEGISDSIHARTENFAQARMEKPEKKAGDTSEKASRNGEEETDEESRETAGKDMEDAGQRSGKRESARPESPEKRVKRREPSRSARLSRR